MPVNFMPEIVIFQAQSPNRFELALSTKKESLRLFRKKVANEVLIAKFLPPPRSLGEGEVRIQAVCNPPSPLRGEG